MATSTVQKDDIQTVIEEYCATTSLPERVREGGPGSGQYDHSSRAGAKGGGGKESSGSEKPIKMLKFSQNLQKEIDKLPEDRVKLDEPTLEKIMPGKANQGHREKLAGWYHAFKPASADTKGLNKVRAKATVKSWRKAQDPDFDSSTYAQG